MCRSGVLTIPFVKGNAASVSSASVVSKTSFVET
jgi:hypothetical protein